MKYTAAETSSILENNTMYTEGTSVVEKKLSFWIQTIQFRLFNSDSLTCGNDSLIEPPRGKTNNVVSDQVLYKPTCTSTEKSKKLEILDLSRRGIVLSE